MMEKIVKNIHRIRSDEHSSIDVFVDESKTTGHRPLDGLVCLAAADCSSHHLVYLFCVFFILQKYFHFRLKR